MYRVAALISMRHNIHPSEEKALVEAVQTHHISFAYEDGESIVLLDDEDVSLAIRTPELTKMVGPVCEIPGIRKIMGALQRKMGEDGGVVLEGRDIGTVVFPDAEVKIYLDAVQDERARRRCRELQRRGMKTNFDGVLKDIIRRDERDMNRPTAPLKKAHDAVIIDTTSLRIEEVVEKVVELAVKYQEKL